MFECVFIFRSDLNVCGVSWCLALRKALNSSYKSVGNTSGAGGGTGVVESTPLLYGVYCIMFPWYVYVESPPRGFVWRALHIRRV